jgi:hypothetical protein
LRFQKHLQKRDHVPSHLTTMVAPPSARLIQPTAIRIWCLRDSDHTGSNVSVWAIDHAVRLDGNGYTFDVDVRESRSVAKGHCS